MARRAALVASCTASVLFAVACGPTSPQGPDAGDDIPDPNCIRDVDTDGDTIADCDEGTEDPDNDTVPSDHDLDSDGDGYPDADEAGDADMATPPRDTDSDGRPDFLDGDSDNDGLLDAQELAAGTNPTNADTDGDGFSDLVEVTIHQLCVMNPDECNGDPDPLDPNVGVSPLDYFFILPYQDPEQRKPLDFATDIAIADVQFAMDTTGSMGDEINALKNGLNSIITQITNPATGVPNTAIGVSVFKDFPVFPYGSAGDVPYQLRQRVSSVASEAQAALNPLTAAGGGDTPESGWEALYQIAAGTGVNWGSGSIGGFNAANGYDANKHGLIGGVGFRAGALPIIVQIGDAFPHFPDGGGTCSDGFFNANIGYPGLGGAHARSAAITALTGIGARVIGIVSNEFSPTAGTCSPRGQLEYAATQTSARVPPAAFDLGGRPAGCSASQCCTGVSGTGKAPDASGLCPLVFEVNANGTGNFVGQVVNAVKSLVNFAVIDVSAAKDSAPQPNAFGGTTDPKDFITDIIPVTLTPTPPGGVQLDGTGRIFLDVTPGTTATFDVQAENTILMQAADPQVFTLKIRVLGDGVTVLDTRQVVIIVPPMGSTVE
jgi:hypothetical protein